MASTDGAWREQSGNGRKSAPFVYDGEIILTTYTSPVEPHFASVAANPAFLVGIERLALVLRFTRGAFLLGDGG